MAVGWEQNKHVPLFFFFSVEVSNVKHTERQWGAVEEQTLDPNGPADPPLSLCSCITLNE